MISKKTFYRVDEKQILKYCTSDGSFDDFWNDIFNLKIMSREDEERKKNEDREIEENKKSHALINGGYDRKTDNEKKIEILNRSYLKKYFKKVMIFNSTPKVNLVGTGSTI